MYSDPLFYVCAAAAGLGLAYVCYRVRVFRDLKQTRALEKLFDDIRRMGDDWHPDGRK